MQAWIRQIEGLALQMEKARISVTEQDKILVVTMGLPHDYDNVIINFDSMSPNQLTMQLIIAQLLNEEVHQGVTVDAPTTRDEALATVPCTKTCTADDITCYFCN